MDLLFHGTSLIYMHTADAIKSSLLNDFGLPARMRHYLIHSGVSQH